MNTVLKKFFGSMETNDGTTLPSDFEIDDIQNGSFQFVLGSDAYIFNIWLKAKTKVPSRTTYKRRMKNIDQCLKIQKLIEDETMFNDDLFDEPESETEMDSGSQREITTEDSNPSNNTKNIISNESAADKYPFGEPTDDKHCNICDEEFMSFGNTDGICNSCKAEKNR